MPANMEYDLKMNATNAMRKSNRRMNSMIENDYYTGAICIIIAIGVLFALIMKLIRSNPAIRCEWYLVNGICGAVPSEAETALL